MTLTNGSSMHDAGRTGRIGRRAADSGRNILILAANASGSGAIG
jgi:hypothetical protein